MRLFFLLSISLVFISCVQLRDYTFKKHGAFGLAVKQKFGEGNANKDYYLEDSGLWFTVGDSQEQITNNFGSPDKIETTLEGYRAWIYKKYNLKIIFSDGFVKEWHSLVLDK